MPSFLKIPKIYGKVEQANSALKALPIRKLLGNL
ncbi:hypothetical protein K3495_g11548 [Podosphaera aphanis]|nr:hypothetical protein K3495_g11548 [Podosphaera aphanis]